jgi:hypothetical protein
MAHVPRLHNPVTSVIRPVAPRRNLPLRAAGWYDGHMPDERKRPPAADRLDDREHPAQPPQTDEGFAEGQEARPDTPEEEEVRDFAEGQEVPPRTEEEEQIGRFSEGQELEGDTPEKVVERRFSEGQDAGPDTT